MHYAGVLLPFPELWETFQLPLWMLFRYMQLKHAAQVQFPRVVTIMPHVAERFLTSQNADRILSSIYVRLTYGDSDGKSPLFRSWKADIPSLSEEEWDLALQQYISTDFF